MLSNICKQNLYVDISTSSLQMTMQFHTLQNLLHSLLKIKLLLLSLTFYHSPSISARMVYYTLSTLRVIPASITGGKILEIPPLWLQSAPHPIHPGKTATHRISKNTFWAVTNFTNKLQNLLLLFNSIFFNSAETRNRIIP